MIRETKIGSGQLFALLYLCRMLTTVTFSPLLGDGLLNGDFTLNIVFALVFILVLCIPSALFYKRFPECTPVSVTDKKMSDVISVFYVFLFLFSASVSVSRFFIFLTSVIYPEKEMGLFLVVAVLVCCYCAYLGVEALFRGNVILLCITAFGVAVILYTVAGKIDIYNFEPLLFHPLTGSIKSGFLAAARTVEIPAFLFLAEKTRGKIKKAFIIAFSVFAVNLFILFFFLNGVSGEFAETQLFPFYSLAVIAKFPFFERLDAVITAVWIFSILIKCSVFINISREQLKRFSFMNNKRSLGFCFISVCALSLIFSYNLGIHKAVSSPYIFIVLTVLGSVVIPLVEVIKNKRILRI